MRTTQVAAAVAVVASLVAGCGTIDLNTLIAIIDPNLGPIQITGCTGPAKAGRVFAGFRQGAQIQADALVAWQALPQELQENAVVKAVLSQAEIIPSKIPEKLLAYAPRLTTPPLAPTPPQIPAPALPLAHSDFYAFANLVSEYAVRQPTSSGNGSAASDIFLQALAKYYQAYYAAPFNTYFSAPFDKPVLSLTINDNEITQAATVFLELLFDFALKSPVWIDGSTSTYYPGSSSSEPTVAYLNQHGFPYQGFAQPEKLPWMLPNGCHMTVTKAKIINYVANQFATAASSDTALTIRSAGGLGISLGVFGKLSIGDNDTLSRLVKAAVSEATLRLTAQLVYYALSEVDIIEPPSLTHAQRAAFVRSASALFISPNR